MIVLTCPVRPGLNKEPDVWLTYHCLLSGLANVLRLLDDHILQGLINYNKILLSINNNLHLD